MVAMVVTSVPCPARLGKVDVGGEQLRLVLAGPDDPPGADAVHAPGGSGDVDGDVVERAHWVVARSCAGAVWTPVSS